MLIFLTACEPSGDRLGAAIIKALQEKLPNARFVGVAGPLMREAGCEALLQQEELAIMGLVEVLKHLPHLLKARKKVTEQALSLKPNIYIGIDAPDFNLTVETQLKTAGIKTVHVNSPTIWAWRKGRIKKIKRAVNLMLTLFPFETKIYDEHQLSAQYIGHPLADEIPLASQKISARKQLGLSEDAKILALMPGSRATEIKYLAPIFCEAAKICADKIPGLKILIPMINERRADQLKAIFNSRPGLLRCTRNDEIKVSIGNAHQVLEASDAVLIASGTATLEAMLCKTPMIVSYKTDALSAWIAKKLIKIPHVSLPNILAEKALVPEFLQEHATVENLSAACLKLLQTDPSTEQLSEFEKLHQALRKNAATQAAEAIIKLLL